MQVKEKQQINITKEKVLQTIKEIKIFFKRTACLSTFGQCFLLGVVTPVYLYCYCFVSVYIVTLDCTLY